MSIFHVGKLAQVPTLSLLIIVALKAQEDCLSALIPTFLALQQECKKNGKLYIKSLRGGRQISKEQWHGKLNVVFLFGFAVSWFMKGWPYGLMSRAKMISTTTSIRMRNISL